MEAGIPETITNPEANPMVLGGLNLVTLGGVGYWMIGQKKKAVISVLMVVFGGFCTLGILYLWPLVAAYDAYLLGQRLAQGETIRVTDNGIPALDRLFK